MKVVFDTNVFVSALTLPDGGGDQALRSHVISQNVEKNRADQYGYRP